MDIYEITIILIKQSIILIERKLFMNNFIIDINNSIQQKSINKFSFPFNGGIDSNVQEWINTMKPYAPFIHDIYFTIPGIKSFFGNWECKDYDNKCVELCELLEKSDWHPKLCAVFNGVHLIGLTPKKELVNKAILFLKKYNIYQCVVNDLDIARLLHEAMPNLILNTSCTVPQYNIPLLKLWKDVCGINIINPNRPMCRNIPYLKELKKNGFQIKLIINGFCSLFCPELICSTAIAPNDSICVNYLNNTTPLQSCMILPRWLNILDEYVDVYKIIGRVLPLPRILNQFQHYILRNDNCYFDEFHSGCQVPIKCSEIPDDLLYCGYSNCNECGKCTNLMKKFAQRYIDSLPKVMYTPI